MDSIRCHSVGLYRIHLQPLSPRILTQGQHAGPKHEVLGRMLKPWFKQASEIQLYAAIPQENACPPVIKHCNGKYII